MPTPVELFEVDINTSQAVKDSQALTIALQEQTKATEELKESQGELSEEYIEAAAQTKVLKKELRENENLTQNVIRANKANTGSITEMRKQLSVVSKQWADLSEDERENQEIGKKLTAQKAALTDKLKGLEKQTGDTRRNVGNYTEGLLESAKATTGLGDVMDVVSKSPLLLAFTVLSAIFATLWKAIQRNEKAMESINKVMAFFKGTVDGVLNALGPLVEFLTEKLLNAFENPVQTIKDLGNAIVDNVVNRFKAVLVLGDALSALLSGNFKEAAKLGADAMIQFGTGVADGTDKIAAAGDAIVDFGKSVVTETGKAIDANKRLANSALELLRIEKDFEKQQLDFQDRAEAQRKIRDDEKLQIEERTAANIELGKVLSEQAAVELGIAKRQQEIALANQQANGVTVETETAVLEARNKIAEINERINAQRSEQLTNETALLKENAERQVEILENTLLAEIALTKEGSLAELEAKRESLEQLKQAELDNKEILNKTKEQIDAEFRAQELELEKEYVELKKEAKIVEFEAQFEAEQNNTFALLDLEKEKLEKQKAQEIKYAESIGADTTNIAKKFAKAELIIDKTKSDAKLALANGLAQNIASVAGKGTAIGKAAATAGVAIDTYQGAFAAYTGMIETVPGPIGVGLGIAAAGAVVASGLSAVKNILSVSSGLPGGGGAGGSSISASVPSSAGTNVPTVNEGIESRNAGTQTVEDINVQPTLVTDDVTVNQDQALANTQTATI